MNLSLDEIKALAARGYTNPVFFCKFFFPEWFPLAMPWVHRGILAILTRKCDFLLEFDEDYSKQDLEKIIANFVWKENPRDDASPDIPIFSFDTEGVLHMALGKYTLIMMPRGFSKTTLVNAVNCYYVLYQDCKFPVSISEAGHHAVRQLTNITGQLTTNPRILTVFGNVKPEQRSGKKWSESEGFIQTTTDISMAARGRGGQIRGLNVDGHRPDRLIFDDIEDKESVATAEQRTKAKEWFFGDALPALPELDPNATAVALGTLLHSDALLTVLEADPDWTTIKFGALDKAGAPLWPANMDERKIERKKRSYASKGLLHVFYLEYFNTIRAPEDAKFRPEMIYHLAAPEDKIPVRAMVIDPAISEKKTADSCSIAVAGICDQGYIQVLESWGKQGASPREQVDKYFELFLLFRPQKCGVESISYQAALVHLLREEMFRRKVYFEITPITHTQRKTERIEGVLQPRYANGYIRHQRRFPELETQLLDWPNGKRDYPDALAMAVSLLDDYAGIVAGDDLADDEYEPLDEFFGGDWRSH